MAAKYEHAPEPITKERRDEIRALIAGLHDAAAYDIEDKRAIYEALVDLLDAAHISFHEE